MFCGSCSLCTEMGIVWSLCVRLLLSRVLRTMRRGDLQNGWSLWMALSLSLVRCQSKLVLRVTVSSWTCNCVTSAMLIAAAGVRRNRREQELDYNHEHRAQRTAVRLRSVYLSLYGMRGSAPRLASKTMVSLMRRTDALWAQKELSPEVEGQVGSQELEWEEQKKVLQTKNRGSSMLPWSAMATGFNLPRR